MTSDITVTQHELTEGVQIATTQRASAFEPSQEAQLNNLKGHLTLFPLDWLRDEDLETYGLDDALFTVIDDEDNVRPA